jgi:hypothetical protein
LANQAVLGTLIKSYYKLIHYDHFLNGYIMPNLNLSDQQTQLIRNVADTFQPALRRHFLASIQDNWKAAAATSLTPTS